MIATRFLPGLVFLLFSMQGVSQPQSTQESLSVQAGEQVQSENRETPRNEEAVQAGAADRNGNGVQSRDRVQQPDAVGGQKAQHQHGKNKGGKGTPNQAGKSGPAGSKNKSQKKGR